eukprot:TRINITY_DN6039_c0_g1_i1.p1 TRINITY_DN6039_c0_g1~~TRINITY_DN6039_c0_g1_i1.p1  ORF type:complete len:530 (-),score=103.12 TRINITY_DN6039_c0_g1_i1:136-1533(-)
MYIFYMKSSPKRHAQKVEAVAEQVRKNANNKMCTARAGYESTSLFVGKYKKTMQKIDLSAFVDILNIDTKKKTVTVEPLVTCGQLSSFLLPLGWTPAVLPELDDLTVGGLIMGFGVETSSHKFGLFQHICVSYKVVLPGGKVVTCSAEENADLFYSIPWSYGTIGFLLSAELRIVPAKKYAKITYQPYQTTELMLDAFAKASNDETNDFVEMLAYGPDRGVLMTGVMTDDAEFWKIHRIGKFWGPWFYKHVEGFFKTGESVEYIPLRDYYHRHTRSLFWEMEDIIPFGHNIIFRILLGWLVPPKIAFLKLTQTQELQEIHEKKHVIEDYLVPMSTLAKTLEMQDKEIGFYPLWLCPCKIYKTPHRGLVNPANDEEMYVDVGIYGIPPSARAENGGSFDYVECHNKAEKFVREIGGFQALYAQTYQNREQFSEMFDHELYQKVREKYGCDKVLPLVYDKVSREARS